MERGGKAMNRTQNNTGRAGGPYEPSQHDIREACEEIQATWSERERNKRAGSGRVDNWTPPQVPLAAVSDAINEETGNGLTLNSGAFGDWINQAAVV
jgi:hypothetical protein